MRVQNMKLALVADSGLNMGSVYPLSESRQVIGRRVDATIPIDDAKASRDHALVDFRNGFFYLVDLGSTNGTYVNGRRVQHATRLSLGDHLRIGNSVFKVELIKKTTEGAARHWHEATCVELDAFRPAEAQEKSEVSLAGVLVERDTGARVHAAQEASSAEHKIRGALSSSLPRWFYLIERKNKVSRLSKRQGLALMLLVCGALVASAIFVGGQAS